VAKALLSTTKNRWIYLISWSIWAFTHYIVLKDWGFPWQPVLIDTLVSNFLLAAACALISNILRYYRPQTSRYLYVLFLCIAISGLYGAVSRFGLGSLLASNPDYSSFFEKSMPVRFDIALLLTGAVAMISMLSYSLEEQKENEKRKSDAEQLSKDAELYKLRQQLQPHFLFNSLNSISALVNNNPEQARNMIQQLSDFLRGTLKKEEHQWVSLSDELQHLGLYLEIEKVRFGHRLETKIIADESTRQLLLPPLLLQPIVENAIKFGLYDTTDAITIQITAHNDKDNLMITVENPFDPQTSSPRRGTGFGLSSVQRRLYLLFSRNDLLSTQANDNTFITTIKIPQYDQGIAD
jgi:two-component system LytT family sensor kinase